MVACAYLGFAVTVPQNDQGGVEVEVGEAFPISAQVHPLMQRPGGSPETFERAASTRSFARAQKTLDQVVFLPDRPVIGHDRDTRNDLPCCLLKVADVRVRKRSASLANRGRVERAGLRRLRTAPAVPERYPGIVTPVPLVASNHGAPIT